ncbi:MAG: cytochrome c oxidase subunit II [Bacteroidia bacterium]
MDPQTLQSLIGIAQILLVLIFGLVCVNLYLVFRLKEIDPFAKWNPHKINGTLFFVFMVVGTVAAFVSTGAWSEHYTLINDPASEHGKDIDFMFDVTTVVAVFVTVVTNALLFFFAWKYYAKPGQKALFYAHNNRLEITWTIIPAIVLTGLVSYGIINWNKITGEAPADSLEVEINAQQFSWTFRYPGPDMLFGETKVSYINEAESNLLGFNTADKRGVDDIITREIHFPVNTNILLKIRSRDVLHSPTLPHFRVKMDAVPGMPTSFHFKPTVTTAEMRQRRGDETFNYEMSCQQICGSAHWNMRAVVVVETMEEYQAWLKSQASDKPYFVDSGNTPTAETEVNLTLNQ